MDTKTTIESKEVEAAYWATQQAKKGLSGPDRRIAESNDGRIIEITLEALQRKRGVLPLNDFAHYASRVARKDQRRRISREKKRCCISDGSFELVSSNGDPVAEAIRKEERENVTYAIHRLPEKQKEVLRRLYLTCDHAQNLTHIAAEMGVTRQTVARWHDMGLINLRTLLQRKPLSC